MIAGFLTKQRKINSHQKFSLVATILLSFISFNSFAADITSIVVSNNTASVQTNVPFTFGHPFKEGDVPANMTLVAKRSDGSTVPLQVDKKAVYGDGSLKHGIFTAKLATLGASAAETLILATQSSGLSGTAVSLATLKSSGFDAKVELVMSGGGNYSASVQDILNSSTPKQWLSGPLASEWIVSGAVKNSSGQAHNHLMAYFHVRAFAGANSSTIDRVNVDVVVENGWTYVPGSSEYNYRAVITMPGSTTVETETFQHYDHARWHKRLWWNKTSDVYIKHNINYLQTTPMMPYYGNLSPSESALSALRQSTAIMDGGDIKKELHQSGFSTGIGPLPNWTALYLNSADKRAFNSILANDDGGGAFGIHVRDEKTGYPATVEDYPEIAFDTSKPGAIIIPASSSNPQKYDVGHKPSLGYVAYLVSGNYFNLEEMQFWANYGILHQNPGTNGSHRNGSEGLLQSNEVRAQAWALRDVGFAAYVTPDNHSLKGYFNRIIDNNMDWYNRTYTNNPGANKLGIIESGWAYSYFSSSGIAPWQHDYFTWTIGQLVEFGFASANEFFPWIAKFSLQRMGIDPSTGGYSGYCWNVAAQYSIRTKDSSTDPTYLSMTDVYNVNFSSIKDIACNSSEMAKALTAADKNETYVIDQITGQSYADAYYFSYMRPALAMIKDFYPNKDIANLAWTRYQINNPKPPPPGVLDDKPIFAVLPKGGNNTAPLILLSAASTTVTSGSSTTLTWSVNNATSCTASSTSNTWQGSKNSVGGSDNTGALTQDTTFTLSCSGPNGSSQKSVTVAIGSVTAPTINTFSAASTTINDGERALLSWTTTSADSCEASNAWSGSKPTSGTNVQSQILNAANSPYTFGLTCTNTGSGKTVSGSIAITVNGGSNPNAPTVSLSANPSTVENAEAVTLTWTVSNATSCNASGDWNGNKNSQSDSEIIGIVNQSSTYTLTCTGSGGSASDSATVSVAGPADLDLDFANFSVSQDPTGWFDTRSGNGLAADDNFKVLDDGGNKVIGTTVTNGVNIHSHYIDGNSATWSNYRFTGRMKFTGASDGIGVTFFSDYPNSDTYYRLRRESSNNSFHLAEHPDTGSSGCTGSGTDTGIGAESNLWYQFLIEAEDLGTETNVRVKVWKQGVSEPSVWQINCNYTGSKKFNDGTVGLWAVSGADTGNKYWDDLRVAPLSGSATPTEPQPTPSDSDGDGLLDQWEMDNFGNLTSSNGSGDTDNDGLIDADEFKHGTNPNNEDSDGDGYLDGAEVKWGSDPNNDKDTRSEHEPAMPTVSSITAELAVYDSVISTNTYTDPDAHAQLSTRWQVSNNTVFTDLVYDRKVLGSNKPLVMPAGVLDINATYYVRAAFIDNTTLQGAWSEVVQFSTLSSYPNDSDNNGVDDTFQFLQFVDIDTDGVDDNLDNKICTLIDAVSSNIISLQVNAGEIACYTSLHTTLLNGSVIPNEGLPYGVFSFAIKNVAVDTVTVSVHFPQGVDAKFAWYHWDSINSLLADFEFVEFTGNTATITLQDAGVGDVDGVNNNVIVSAGGLRGARATGTGNGTPTEGDGGGALTISLLLLLFTIFAVRYYGRSNLSAKRW